MTWPLLAVALATHYFSTPRAPLDTRYASGRSLLHHLGDNIVSASASASTTCSCSVLPTPAQPPSSAESLPARRSVRGILAIQQRPCIPTPSSVACVDVPRLIWLSCRTFPLELPTAGARPAQRTGRSNRPHDSVCVRALLMAEGRWYVSPHPCARYAVSRPAAAALWQWDCSLEFTEFGPACLRSVPHVGHLCVWCRNRSKIRLLIKLPNA